MAKAKKTSSLRKPVSFSMGSVLLFVLIFAAVGGYAVWKSFAAPAPPATLTASPNPGSSSTAETFTGCGYNPSAGTTIVVYTPIAVSWFGDPSDANGCINITHGINSVPGTYKVNAWQTTLNNAKRSKIMGSTTYTVN
jgi:hypothetical protein